MSYNDYKVYCFKDVDFIATRVDDIDKIISYYNTMFEDNLNIEDIKEIKDKNKEFILINEDTNFKETTTYNKLIEEYIVDTDGEEYLYLCSKEW